MVSHGVFARERVVEGGGLYAIKWPRLRGGKNVCSHLCCHTRASGHKTTVTHTSVETIQYSAHCSATPAMQKD